MTMNDKINPVDIYAKVISEQVRKEKGYVTEAAGKDKTYAADRDDEKAFEKHSKILDKVAAHAKAKGYKVNHDSSEAEISKLKKHAKPDITLHYERGEDEHSAYTVHHNGAAANDAELHKHSKKLMEV